MDREDLKKWLADQISYLEKTKEQPDKFAWDPEYDLQLAAFRMALDRLEPVGPLTIEQLREMDVPTPVWAEVEWKTIEGWNGYWCLCQEGVVLTPSRIITQADQMDGVRFYTYPPTNIDRDVWKERWIPMSDDDGNKWFRCSSCNYDLHKHGYPLMFCPKCGKPMKPKPGQSWKSG